MSLVRHGGNEGPLYRVFNTPHGERDRKLLERVANEAQLCIRTGWWDNAVYVSIGLQPYPRVGFVWLRRPLDEDETMKSLVALRDGTPLPATRDINPF